MDNTISNSQRSITSLIFSIILIILSISLIISTFLVNDTQTRYNLVYSFIGTLVIAFLWFLYIFGV